ncbi:MAG TPA: type III-B CRISPR-associated protein Cas10/Cmr2 [Thermoanaerobaculia bacterium]
MKRETALLTFGIGPVHTFIAQARRVADVWAGSYLLSHLVRQAISVLRRDLGGEMVFPFIEGELIPDGVPNRFVCRVPADRATEIALAMQANIEGAWDTMVVETVRTLEKYSLRPAADLWIPSRTPGGLRQTDRLLQFSWSWVSEKEGYARASAEGARRFTAARLFRPFPQAAEHGEKCAICGERTALPDGDRGRVRESWEKAEERAKADQGADLERFLRFDQGRLCLVCATKRFFTYHEERRRSSFKAFDRFQPSDEAPYFALVKMDGDRMGGILGLGPDLVTGGDLETFHRAVSKALTEFARDLRLGNSPDLNLETLGGYEPRGEAPQLIYAGGDDALLVCDPRDALPLVSLLREHYQRSFASVRDLFQRPEDRERFTSSAAVIFAHSGHPAGLLLRDLEILLKEKAKAEAGRNAVAIRLDKRSGAPSEVAFRWQDEAAPAEGWMKALGGLIDRLARRELSSGQSFSLRLEERTLLGVFQDAGQWQGWLAERLTRNVETAENAEELARQVTPFFLERKSAALRIARFLGREVAR